MGCVRRGWACWIFPSDRNTKSGFVSRVSLLSGVDAPDGAILLPEVQEGQSAGHNLQNEKLQLDTRRNPL